MSVRKRDPQGLLFLEQVLQTVAGLRRVNLLHRRLRELAKILLFLFFEIDWEQPFQLETFEVVEDVEDQFVVNVGGLLNVR